MRKKPMKKTEEKLTRLICKIYGHRNQERNGTVLCTRCERPVGQIGNLYGIKYVETNEI